MRKHPLADLARRGIDGRRHGITSICSAHPFVLDASLRQAAQSGTVTLIEATCNQVNHRGGYTGMTPAAFHEFVYGMADAIGLPRDAIILGGDHLGPNPWRRLPAEAAMQESERMVAAYVEAGFSKIHLDTSMACHDDPVPLDEETIAARAARLAAVAERASAPGDVVPFYVIGTEVPLPGGAHETIATLDVTEGEAVVRTMETHRRAFAAAGIDAAFARVIAVVVQPGVEFGSENVVRYVPERAASLSASLDLYPGLVFEAHSTDYQPANRLASLIQDRFAILKVGPGLTFAMREALYGLDAMARILKPYSPSLFAEMERVMLAQPADWQPYYLGSEDAQRVARHFSYSDRIRYYWPRPEARQAVERLFAELDGVRLTEPLISQYFPRLYERVAAGDIAAEPHALVRESVCDVLRAYHDACR